MMNLKSSRPSQMIRAGRQAQRACFTQTREDSFQLWGSVQVQHRRGPA